MDKLTIEVPENKWCEVPGFTDTECPCMLRHVSYCNQFHTDLYSDETFKQHPRTKCPACIAAIKAYKNTHDYEKAREKLRKEFKKWNVPPNSEDTLAGIALKALRYKEKS